MFALFYPAIVMFGGWVFFQGLFFFVAAETLRACQVSLLLFFYGLLFCYDFSNLGLPPPSCYWRRELVREAKSPVVVEVVQVQTWEEQA